MTDLAEKCDASHAVVQALVKKGVIVTESARVERDPFGDESFVHAAALAMNAEQLVVFERVKHAIEHGGEAVPKPILLHGVTGSGKTEIYLQAIHLVLERGQSAIMLVPEISLTPQTVERFKSRFAATRHEVAVLHSHLSEGERHDEWHKIRDGRARIVIRRALRRFLRPSAPTSASSWSMKSTRIPTSRKKRRATTGATWRCSGRAWKSARSCSGAPRRRWRAFTMRRRANTSCCGCWPAWMTRRCPSSA